MSNYLPIAALEQRDAVTSSSLVRGIVTLIWPYSQSSKRTAILLADPDFRLRHRKGQVRIQFSGASALAFAKSEIAIGDEVILALRGARWVDSESGVVSTPGRSVSFELRYGHELDAEVLRNGSQYAHLRVDQPVASTPSHSEPQTPMFSTPYTPMERMIETFEMPLSTSAPTFHQSARKASGNLVDSTYDPFLDEEFDLRQTKRPRISWGSQKRYKMTDQIPSPKKEENELNFLADDIEFADVEEDDSVAQIQRESFAATAVPVQDFGDLRSTFAEEHSSSPEFQGPMSNSFSIFRDPPLLFSRTTTSTAPRYSFTSHELIATQTQPTVSSQDDVFRSDELTTSQLASQQLQYHLQSPEKLAEGRPGVLGDELVPADDERESSPMFVPHTPEFVIPQRRQAASQSPMYSLGPHRSGSATSEMPESIQDMSQPHSTGFSQPSDPSLNVFDPLQSFGSTSLQIGHGVLSSPISVDAGLHYSQVDVDSILSEHNIPTHLQVLNGPGTVAEIPGFVPYADDDWTNFHEQAPFYSEILSQQPTQESEYAPVTYPQIPGLDDQRIIPESLDIGQEQDPPNPELLVEESQDQSTALRLSLARQIVGPEAHENVGSQSLSTPTRRANAILSTIRNQLSPSQMVSQDSIPETIEQQTPPIDRKSLEPKSPIQSSPLSPVISLLQHTATKSPVSGFRTRTSYFSHLSNLISTLNRISQYDSIVDILAIVTRDSARPLRAEKGQKDYFTKFRVTQPGHWPLTTLVSVFRPFKAALPTARKGEVVLLRDFEGISLKGGLVGLISSERSGWCVFKRLTERDEGGYRVREKSVGAEETRGPPVEFGKEEREEAERLIEWWDGLGN